MRQAVKRTSAEDGCGGASITSPSCRSSAAAASTGLWLANEGQAYCAADAFDQSGRTRLYAAAFWLSEAVKPCNT